MAEQNHSLNSEELHVLLNFFKNEVEKIRGSNFDLYVFQRE